MTSTGDEGATTSERSRTAACYVLRLYISGCTPSSQRAVASVRRICDEHVGGRYELEVIDVYQQPELARREKVVATPTLLKAQPLPPRRLVGDLSATDRVLCVLGLAPRAEKEAPGEGGRGEGQSP